MEHKTLEGKGKDMDDIKDAPVAQEPSEKAIEELEEMPSNEVTDVDDIPGQSTEPDMGDE